MRCLVEGVGNLMEVLILKRGRRSSFIALVYVLFIVRSSHVRPDSHADLTMDLRAVVDVSEMFAGGFSEASAVGKAVTARSSLHSLEILFEELPQVFGM